MSKSKETLVTKVKMSDIVKTDASIDMNSIVAFFISKYETQLLDNKKELSAKITEKVTYLDGAFITELEADVKLSSFVVSVPSLGLVTEATIREDNSDFKKKSVTISISHDTDKSENCHFSAYKKVKISDELHKKYIDTVNEVDALRVSLRDTLEKLSSISRKERELRGALAEKTIRESGGGELFDDEALLRLVNLPQLSLKTIK